MKQYLIILCYPEYDLEDPQIRYENDHFLMSENPIRLISAESYSEALDQWAEDANVMEQIEEEIWNKRDPDIFDGVQLIIREVSDSTYDVKSWQRNCIKQAKIEVKKMKQENREAKKKEQEDKERKLYQTLKEKFETPSQ